MHVLLASLFIAFAITQHGLIAGLVVLVSYVVISTLYYAFLREHIMFLDPKSQSAEISTLDKAVGIMVLVLVVNAFLSWSLPANGIYPSFDFAVFLLIALFPLGHMLKADMFKKADKVFRDKFAGRYVGAAVTSAAYTTVLSNFILPYLLAKTV